MSTFLLIALPCGRHTYTDYLSPHRICPGMHFAQNLVYLVVSRMITCFEIVPWASASGQLELPPLDFTIGVISYVTQLVSLINF
jgi:hypothetical protein